MSVQESLAAKQKGLTQISGWVEEHALELEELIRQEEMRLFRLREMQDYFTKNQGVCLQSICLMIIIMFLILAAVRNQMQLP